MSSSSPLKIVHDSSLPCIAPPEKLILFYSLIRVTTATVTLCELKVKKGVTVLITYKQQVMMQTTPVTDELLSDHTFFPICLKQVCRYWTVKVSAFDVLCPFHEALTSAVAAPRHLVSGVQSHS